VSTSTPGRLLNEPELRSVAGGFGTSVPSHPCGLSFGHAGKRGPTGKPIGATGGACVPSDDQHLISPALGTALQRCAAA
jgi:hypothetical protein